jgi:hypothetical protein
LTNTSVSAVFDHRFPTRHTCGGFKSGHTGRLRCAGRHARTVCR